MYYSEAKELFNTARFPSNGKPMEGSKNLRMYCQNGIYYVHYHSSPILMVKPDNTYWNVAVDSLSTRRHVNSLAPHFYVNSRNCDLFAECYGMPGKYLISAGVWYCKDNMGQHAFIEGGERLCRYTHGAWHVLQNPVVKTIHPRRKTLDNRAIVDPRRGQSFFFQGKAYIWLISPETQSLKAYEYRGDAPSSQDRYVYAGKELSGFDAKNIIYPFKAHDMLSMRDAIPIKPFTGSPDSSILWRYCEGSNQ
jgi:hypothetical protein